MWFQKCRVIGNFRSRESRKPKFLTECMNSRGITGLSLSAFALGLHTHSNLVTFRVNSSNNGQFCL